MRMKTGLVRHIFFVALLSQLVFQALAFAAVPVVRSAPTPRATSTATVLADEPVGIMPILQLGFASTSEAAQFKIFCDSIRFENHVDFEFSDMEKRLLCGDERSDQVGVPWSKIPPNQAAYFLRGFLQTRGYHEPIFIQDGETLFVRPGYMSRLVSFSIRGGPDTWAPPRRRLVKGEPLTPLLLDDLEAWSLSQIKNEGYACATAETRGDPRTGETRVQLEAGTARLITKLVTTGDTGLREGALNRYNAFLVGSLYREKLITLTKSRTILDGFLQTIILSAQCEDDGGVTVTRNVVLGPSKTIRIGVGASTDEGARLRAIVKQNRIGSSASSAQARLNISYLDNIVNRQVADSSFRWYYSSVNERSFVEPEIVFERSVQAAYEARSIEAKVLHGWNREYQTGQFELRLGPSYLYSLLSRGEGPDRSSLMFTELGGRWRHHDFEFYGQSPRTGEYVDSSVLVTQKRWGANFTAQKLQIQGQKLWNVFKYDPPLLVVGFRFNVSSVFSPDKDISSDLPIRFLTFLGGEGDLRGFNALSLPRSGLGALSGATGSFEARLHKVIARRADVFSFIDAGILGQANFAFERPLLMSPGVGVRWESPVGTLRGYVAKRFALEEVSDQEVYRREWRIGFTLGEEF